MRWCCSYGFTASCSCFSSFFPWCSSPLAATASFFSSLRSLRCFLCCSPFLISPDITRSRQDASIECHIGGSIRPSSGCNGVHFALLNPLFFLSLSQSRRVCISHTHTKHTWPKKSGRHRLRAPSPKSSGRTQTSWSGPSAVLPGHWGGTAGPAGGGCRRAGIGARGTGQKLFFWFFSSFPLFFATFFRHFHTAEHLITRLTCPQHGTLGPSQHLQVACRTLPRAGRPLASIRRSILIRIARPPHHPLSDA